MILSKSVSDKTNITNITALCVSEIHSYTHSVPGLVKSESDWAVSVNLNLNLFKLSALLNSLKPSRSSANTEEEREERGGSSRRGYY